MNKSVVEQYPGTSTYRGRFLTCMDVSAISVTASINSKNSDELFRADFYVR